MAEEFNVGDKVLYLGSRGRAFIMRVDRIYEEGNETWYVVEVDGYRVSRCTAGRLIKLSDKDIKRLWEEYRFLLKQRALSDAEWKRLAELMTGKEENELTDEERAELKALVEKLKSNNPDDPDIQALKI